MSTAPAPGSGSLHRRASRRQSAFHAQTRQRLSARRSQIESDDETSSESSAARPNTLRAVASPRELVEQKRRSLVRWDAEMHGEVKSRGASLTQLLAGDALERGRSIYGLIKN